MEQQHYTLHTAMLEYNARRVVLRVEGQGDCGVSSFVGCAACGAHPIVTGGDWLLGAEEGARRARLSACAKCECVVYCDRACQSAHWEVHRRTCKPTAAMVMPFVDLGREPTQAAMSLAVAVHKRAAAIAAPGITPPVPTYLTKHGQRLVL